MTLNNQPINDIIIFIKVDYKTVISVPPKIMSKKATNYKKKSYLGVRTSAVQVVPYSVSNETVIALVSCVWQWTGHGLANTPPKRRAK